MHLFKDSNEWDFVVGSSFDAKVVQCSVQFNKHLKARKVRIRREKDLAEIPVLHMSTATSDDEKVAAIVKNLPGRGHSRRRKMKTLANTINTLFIRRIEEGELMALINDLQEKRYIVVNEGSVSYKLPQ